MATVLHVYKGGRDRQGIPTGRNEPANGHGDHFIRREARYSSLGHITTPDRPPVVGTYPSHLRDYEYVLLGAVSTAQIRRTELRAMLPDDLRFLQARKNLARTISEITLSPILPPQWPSSQTHRQLQYPRAVAASLNCPFNRPILVPIYASVGTSTATFLIREIG